MNKTKILICTVFILFFAGALYLLYAQEQFNSDNPEYLALAGKLDALSVNIQKTNADIQKKLALILSNQDKIIAELAIVKVRASRR